MIAVNWIFLNVIFFIDHGFHKVIINSYGNISARNFPLFQFRINKIFRIGMIDRHRKHQGASSSILRNFACRIRISFHKRNQTCGSECRIFHCRTFRTDIGKIMTYSTTAFHELNLLFVNFHNASVRITVRSATDYKTIGKRRNLEIITNSRHRTSLRNNIFEFFDEIKDFLFRK